MTHRSVRRSLIVGFMSGILLAFAGTARASSILPGWDLLTTQGGTAFMGHPFVGVPLVTYDFGLPIGVRNVGSTDTIVRRLVTASAPSTTIPIELVALQLVSAMPINLGAGLDFHYVTLQSARGGPSSTGSMTINFDFSGSGGSFTSFFDVFFDIRIGALIGPIIFSDHDQLSPPGPVSWSDSLIDAQIRPFDEQSALLRHRVIDGFAIAGVNDGFFPGATPVPEPASLILLGSGLVGIARFRRKRLLNAR